MLSSVCRRIISSPSVAAVRKSPRAATLLPRAYSSISATEIAERTKRMLEAKEQACLSYDQLSSKLGVTNTYTAQLLMGQAKLTSETAIKLQEALPNASKQDLTPAIGSNARDQCF